MGQVTIYLDNQSEQRMKQAAQEAGMSVSRWVAELVQDKTRNEWPQEVREAAGAWSDFPDAETLRKDLGQDTAREPL
jgi:hypothetical protein